MSKERLEELAYNVGISLDGEKALMSSDDYDFLYNYAIQQAERVQELEQQNKRYRELLLKIFKVTQNHQIEKISDYAFSRAGMLFYEWLGASGVIDLDRYCDEVNGHDNYDEYNIERMIDEMIKGRIKLEESE